MEQTQREPNDTENYNTRKFKLGVQSTEER